MTDTKKTTEKTKRVTVESKKIPFEFHNQFTPAWLIHKLRDDAITVTDLLLLYAIGTLTQHFDDGTGRGCYASNEYFGMAAKVHPNYVSGRLKALAEKGMILIVNVDNKRYVETEWSRTAAERASLAGAYGKAIKRAYREMMRMLGREEPETEDEGGLRKTLRGVKENMNPSSTKHEHKEEEVNKEEITSPDSPAANGGMNGHIPFGGEVKRTKARILADNLRDGLQAKRLIRNNNYNSAKWEKAFVSLLSDYKFSEINGDILIHVENVTGDYWPKCLSAESFCRDYPKIRLHIDKLKRKSGDYVPEESDSPKKYRMEDGRTMYTTEDDE